MKKVTQILKPTKRSNQTEISSIKSDRVLDINSMKRICGGDGADNGGSEIIIPIPTGPKK